MLFLLLYPLTYFILIKQIIFSYTKIRLQKTLYSTRSCVNWVFFGTRGPLKRSFHSHFKLAHSCQKNPNLHTNSLNLLLFNKGCTF
jgi:hypothetical protein